jgi:hypothetical protein
MDNLQELGLALFVLIRSGLEQVILMRSTLHGTDNLDAIWQSRTDDLEDINNLHDK